MPARVECRSLTYTFPARVEPALKDITLALEPGSWTLVAGSSGCGKSTLLQSLAGLLSEAEGSTRQGTLRVGDRDPQSLPAAERAALVGLVLQSADQQICTTTVESEVAFGLENLALDATEIDSRIAEALAFVGLESLRQRRVTELSGGQRQRLVLAAVLAMRPQVLLLDEPLSQLDPSAAQQFMAVLDRLRVGGPTLVVAEHRVAPWIERVDRLLIVEDGQLSVNVARVEGPRWKKCLRIVADRGVRQLSPRAWNYEEELAELQARRAAARESGCDLSALTSPEPPRRSLSPEPSSAPIVELADLIFTYDRRRLPVIDRLCVQIHPGERVALLGANGSGKSTFLALLSGVHQPQAGLINFAPSESPAVALVAQNPDGLLFCRTVREELAFAPRSAGCRDDEIAARVADAARRFHLEEHLDRASILLSQGERLRVALAATFTLHARLLVLDEPTTGQDPWHEAELMDALGDAVEHGGPPESLLFSTHDLLVAERYAERVLVLDGGRLVADDAPARGIDAFREILARGAAP